MLSRRRRLEAELAVGIAAPFAAARSQAANSGALEDLTEFRRLVAANRILANENVVDAFGHVSVRHPGNAQRYVMSRSRSPERVEPDDLMEFMQTGEQRLSAARKLTENSLMEFMQTGEPIDDQGPADE